MGTLFETTVLSEFGKVNSTLRDVEGKVHSRIDSLETKLSDRLSGMEIRIDRVAAATTRNSEELSLVQCRKTGKKCDSVPPSRRTTPFGITVDDLRGFLKILPFLVALGGGVAAAITGTSPDGTGPEKPTSKSSPERGE